MHVTTVPDHQWEEVPVCPLCDSAEYLLHVATVEAVRRGPELAACTACEYGFLRRRPTSGWFDAYYGQDWDRKGQGGRSPKVKPDKHLLAFCDAHLTAPARVLDAGAGFGKALLAFKQAGYDVQGLEPSEHRAAFVRDMLGIACETVQLESAPFGEEFDLVVMQHVMEHVREPVAAVRAARRLLRPGGRLYVAVPNFWREPAPQSVHYIPHHSLFTEHALRLLLERAGVRVEAIDAADEIKIIGVREDSPMAPASGSEDAQGFESRVREWVQLGFGSPPSRRAVVWFKPRRRGRAYDGYDVVQVPGGRGVRLVRAAVRARGSHGLAARTAGRILRRLAPVDVSSKAFRMLPVDVKGAGLPLVVRHQGKAAPVWVK